MRLVAETAGIGNANTRFCVSARLGYCIDAVIRGEGGQSDQGQLSDPIRTNEMRRLYVFVAIASLSVGSAAIGAKAPTPKISKARAKAIALKAAPGQIKDAEYEYEGHGWRWSFDIQQK